MTSAQSGLIVDADGHVLEPADTWLTYIDPQYRDRAIQDRTRRKVLGENAVRFYGLAV